MRPSTFEFTHDSYGNHTNTNICLIEKYGMLTTEQKHMNYISISTLQVLLKNINSKHVYTREQTLNYIVYRRHAKPLRAYRHHYTQTETACAFYVEIGDKLNPVFAINRQKFLYRIAPEADEHFSGSTPADVTAHL